MKSFPVAFTDGLLAMKKVCLDHNYPAPKEVTISQEAFLEITRNMDVECDVTGRLFIFVLGVKVSAPEKAASEDPE